jgi:hypothetical protein
MQRLTGKASLTEKLTGLQYPDDASLALLRYDGDLNLGGLNVEDRIRRVALLEDGPSPFVPGRGPRYPD